MTMLQIQEMELFIPIIAYIFSFRITLCLKKYFTNFKKLKYIVFELHTIEFFYFLNNLFG